MKWFDSNFDYVQELIDRWNSRRKKIRAIYFIIAAILIIAGILTAIFPVRIFIVIQYLAAAAIIIVGIYHFIAFSSMTYYFRDYTLLLSGILNVLMGVLIMIMPLTLTVQVITFMFAFVLLFSGFRPAPEALLQPARLLNLLYLGLGASALCFVTWNFAVGRLGAVKTSTYIYLVPVVTLVTSALTLGEPVTPLSAAGAALTVAGLLLSGWRGRNDERAEKACEAP